MSSSNSRLEPRKHCEKKPNLKRRSENISARSSMKSATREVVSVPDPLGSDSDSDFTPGAYIPPSPKKRKASISNVYLQNSDGLSQPKKKRRPKRSDYLDRMQKGGARPRARKQLRVESNRYNPSLQSYNPLSEFFDDDLFLKSVSEDEDEDGHVEEDNDMDDEAEDSDTGRSTSDARADDVHDGIIKANTLRAMLTIGASLSQTLPPTLASSYKLAGANDGQEESVAESESDVDFAVPESSLAPSTIQQDDSVTESESEADINWQRSLKRHISENAPEDDASYTESESDFDINMVLDKQMVDTDWSRNPKPNFSRSPQEKISALVLEEVKGISVPASINIHLRSYQRDGVNFFYNQYKNGLGGVLGDDMGLGKTIQVISFLAAIMHKTGDDRDALRRYNHVSHLQDQEIWKRERRLPPADSRWPTCLIVAPSTVVKNWEREFETWGYFEVGIYMDTPKQRADVLKDMKLGRLDVVITSFDLLRRDITQLGDLPWTIVIVDEVHRVKNPTSSLAQALHSLHRNEHFYGDAPEAVRFGLTGTAIQNDYMELWTILDWTNPLKLGTRKQWKGYVQRPLTIGQSKNATEEEMLRSQQVARILKDKLLPKYFKRRTKEIIKDQLPQKYDKVVFCPLSNLQIDVYKRILATDDVSNLIHKDSKCECGLGDKRGKCCHQVDPATLFRTIALLIRISNHLALIIPSDSDTPEQRERNRHICEIAFPDRAPPKLSEAIFSPGFCGKWNTLNTLLKQWKSELNTKVLIFTKSVKLLEMLEFHLKRQNYGFVSLSGQTPQKDRMPIIDKFNQNPDVFAFIISIMAGGTGLNLTAANKVVIFDPSWNPAHDLQAMDRAYRFGQTRDVLVYRLLGAGSIEELIYARQLYKQQQMRIGYDASIQTRYFSGVKDDKERQGELFGVKNIFKLHDSVLRTKMAIEDAAIQDLRWSLAYGRGKKSLQKMSNFLPVESTQEDDDLGGLGALLFGDDDVLDDTLKSIGVEYSHINEEILKPSNVEEQRTNAALQMRKRRLKSVQNLRRDSGKFEKGKEKSKPAEAPKAEWPPKRKHHRPQPSPESLFTARKEALLSMGMVTDASQLNEFAQVFTRKPREEQESILAELDAYSRKHSQA